MSRRPIGYYVHHRGAGHRERARALAALIDRPCVLIGTFEGSSACDEWQLDLPDDAIGAVEGQDGAPDRPDCFHYAPVGVPAIRERMARIAGWVETFDPVMMIIDVSVEVTLLARLLSVPTVVVRLTGDRTDTPHLAAFRAAERLIAPFPREFESRATPEWVRQKTIYAGFLSPPAWPVHPDMDDAGKRISVVFGRGGTGGRVSLLASAARAVPDYMWEVLGPVDGPRVDCPPNLLFRGWVDDVGRRIAQSSLVIGTGGDGVMAIVAAYGKRFICIPEHRPFDEQQVKAQALHRMGAAIHHGSWDEATDWPRLVAAALALDPSRLASLSVPDALAQAARSIDRMADVLARRAPSMSGLADPTV